MRFTKAGQIFAHAFRDVHDILAIAVGQDHSLDASPVSG